MRHEIRFFQLSKVKTLSVYLFRSELNSWTIPAVQLSETSKVQSEMEISLPSLNLKEKPDVLDKHLNHAVNRDSNRGQTRLTFSRGSKSIFRLFMKLLHSYGYI